MPRLIALDLPGGPLFVEALQRVWDAGDAALPVDQRYPQQLKRRLLGAMQPARVIDATGACIRVDGPARPTTVGDALVVATSGTTGEPRGVVLTHEAVAAHAAAVHARLGADADRDRWLACLPLSHIGGLGVVTRALMSGIPLDVHAGFDASAVTAAARSGGATLVSLVPTALERVEPRDFRTVVLGGSPDWRARAGNVVHTYGLTESGGGVVYDGNPLDGVERRVVDGEVQLRGPMLLRCYRDGVDPKDGEGWLPTGDLGRIDHDGSLVVAGRRGDLIVTGGENVWPDAVEAALRHHPKVAQVAVAGRPDAEWGQLVVAYVVPVSGGEGPPTLSELRAFASTSLPAYAAPRHLVLLADLPRTALGKVRRSALPEL